MVHVAMFAKHWQAGKVKTRLAHKIGFENSSVIYLGFLRHLTSKLCKTGQKRSIIYAPADAKDVFVNNFGEHWQLQPQSSGGLGERMANFFRENLQRDPKVVLIGSDTPDITPARIQAAADLLDKNDVVLGPSLDGGYYLIAMRTMNESIFQDVEWSTETVLEQTIEKLKTTETSYDLLPPMQDVDMFPELVTLQEKLEAMSDRDELDDQLLELLNPITSEFA